jgi:XTP/dITP diphosphohydrolase
VVGLLERGSEGFGYDSLFRPRLSDGTISEGTFGELSSEIKHALSHRGDALRKLAAKL